MTKDLDRFLDRRLTAAELALWPLLHGTLRLETVVDSIRIEGLRAPGRAGQASNSFGYDQALGRTRYVFLSPARLHGGYGFGHAILVDPAILSSPGVKCAFYDIGEVIRQIGYLVDHPNRRLQPWVLEPKALKALVEEHSKRIEEFATANGVPAELRRLWIEQRTIDSVSTSQEFLQYYGKYLLEPKVFLDALVAAHRKAASLRAVLERQALSFEPEVLVPCAVEAQYLLGYLNGGVWHPWRSPASPEVAERIHALVTLWSSRK